MNAAAFYDADVLVFGGDLMGKALVPIVREGGRLRAEFLGEPAELEEGSALQAFVRRVEVTGFYWSVMDGDEYRQLRGDPLRVEALMQDLARERLRAWVAFAEERLGGTGVRAFLTGGNDDAPAVLDVLEEGAGDRVIPCEGRIVELDDRHTMITVGLSSPTPWNTPREAPEDEIAAAIRAAAAGVSDPARSVFNLHCPPKDTILDRCLKVTVDPAHPERLPTPVRVAGRFVTIGGGSTAVLQAVSEYQPAVALHGHIHESPGRLRVGRTPCFNPGSEYAQGRLEGALVTLRDGAVTAYQHTSG